MHDETMRKRKGIDGAMQAAKQTVKVQPGPRPAGENAATKKLNDRSTRHAVAGKSRCTVLR